MARIIELRDQDMWINAETYPPADEGCYLLCLSSRQVSIIRQMVPPALWPTRFCRRITEHLFEVDQTALAAEHRGEVDDLLSQLSKEADMSCTQLSEALLALAEAVAANPGAGCTTHVSCGGGGTGVANQIGGVVGGLTPEEILGPAPVDPPDEGIPPEGFETWAEYQEWKCQAATLVWQTVRNAMVTFSGLTGAGAVTNAITGTVVAALGGAAIIAATPAAIVLAVGICLSLAILAAGVFTVFSQMVATWDTRRDEIICQLYMSGDAAQALEAIAGEVEDAIQAIEWGAVLGPIAGEAAPLISELMGQVETNALVNPLFHLVTDITLPDAECICETATVLRTRHTAPYDILVIGDGVSEGTDDDEQGFYVDDSGPRLFYFTPGVSTTILQLTLDFYETHDGWTVLGCEVKRAGDNQHMGSFTVPNSNGSWQSVDDESNISLVAGTQYYLRCSGSGGNNPWLRSIEIVSLEA